MAAPGLCCSIWAFFRCGAGDAAWLPGTGCSSQWVSHCSVCALGHMGSVVVERGLSCPTACGIFPDQGSTLCSLHCQADSSAAVFLQFYTHFFQFTVCNCNFCRPLSKSDSRKRMVKTGIFKIEALKEKKCKTQIKKNDSSDN